MHFPVLLCRPRAGLLLISALLLSPALQAAPPAKPAGPEPLHFLLPDAGAAPWLFLMPGASQPEGVVATILQAAARQTGRPLRYEFLPREQASDTLRRGTADGALFFTVTRPPTRELVLTEPLAQLDALLVTPKDQPLDFRLPSRLADKKLCTQVADLYPPLALLSMKGKLWQTRAKTEQAALMMLRFESCSAAVLSGPTWRWLSTRSDWSDLRAEPRPLLRENLVLGFASRERGFAEAVNRALREMRASGQLAERISQWLPKEVPKEASKDAPYGSSRERAPRLGLR